MKSDFDFSTYTSVCVVEISSFNKALTISRSNNRLAAPETTNASTYYYQGPLGFYYNKANGEIIYGSKAISHYKQYPTSTPYEYIANFLNELQQIYVSPNIHSSIDKHDSVLYKATIAFLTKVWLGNRLEKIYDLATTQFVFLLPKENSETGFVDKFLRPLLLKTSWLSACEPKNKLIFIDDMQAYMYSLQDPRHGDNITLQREGRYLICNIQHIKTRNEIAIELGVVQMVYDKDIVAVSNQSMMALGSNPLLEPKLISPMAIHKFTIAPSVEDMRSLAKFVFLRIFAESSEDIIGDDRLSDYCSDNIHYNKDLFEDLLWFLQISINDKVSCIKRREDQAPHPPEIQVVLDSSQRINMDLTRSVLNGKLNIEQKEKLSSITYEDIFKNLGNNSNCISITNIAKEYMESNITDEIINSTLVSVNHAYWASLNGQPKKSWIYEELLDYYFSKARYDLIKQLNDLKNNRLTHMPQIISDYSLKGGCIYRIFKMFEVSSKLQQPIIKHHSRSAGTGKTSRPQKSQPKDAFIDGIKANGFYVEVNITTEQVTKLSLNQVVETNETNSGLEKSTLPVCELVHQLDDMYETICTNIWNMTELDSESCPIVSHRNCNIKQLDRYTNFKDRLKALISDMLMNRQREITDLDENINFHLENINCKQDTTITHRVVMDVGILPYLREFAATLTSSLKSKSMFANYDVAYMVITGELFHSWLISFNTIYGEYMWAKFSAELSSRFHVGHIRTKLILAKEIITSDHNQEYIPLRREKYLQISSKDYVLNIRNLHGPAIKVYHCQENKCVSISAIKIENRYHWQIPLWKSNHLDGLHPIRLEKEFFISLKKDDIYSYQTSNTMEWILYSIEVLQTSSNMEKVPEVRSLPKEGRLLRLFLNNHYRLNDRSLDDDLYQKTTFPLKVKIEPCAFSHSVSIKMSLGVNMSNDSFPLNEYISNPLERLTLTPH